MISIEKELNEFLKEPNRQARIDRDTWEDIITFAWRYEELVSKEKLMIYNELIDKVSSWWDEVYPADIFPVVSEEEDRDIGAIKVAEIRELLDKIKALPERNRDAIKN